MQSTLLSEIIGQPWLAVTLLFLLLLGSVEFGRIFGKRQIAKSDSDLPGTGAINGAIFALLGLILAFTFSGAATRFEGRRDLIVAESNAIGTAALRVDLVAEDAQPALRDAFKRYVASRIAVDEVISKPKEYRAALKKSAAIQAEIWRLAVAAGRRPDALPAVNISLLPALNEMIDITSTRAFATLMHPPPVIHVMLIGLAVLSGFLAGIGLAPGRKHGWIHPIVFSLIMTSAIYVTIDMEYPRAGFIRVDGFEKAVIDFNQND
jgi:hypothetical protein